MSSKAVKRKFNDDHPTAEKSSKDNQSQKTTQDDDDIADNEEEAEAKFVKKTYQSILDELPDDENAKRATAAKALKSALKVQNLLHFNRLIVDMGNTRGLYTYAKRAFDSIKEVKLEPNVYSYTNIINACARASELQSGLEYFEAAKNDTNIVLDDVIYSAVIKLYCSCGELNKAVDILYLLCNQKRESEFNPNAKVLYPKLNVRAFNSVIRQCATDNNIILLEEVYNLLQHIIESKTHDELSISATIYEFMCTTYAINFDIPKALEYYEKLNIYYTKELSTHDRDVAPYAYMSAGVQVCNACIALNDLKTTRRIYLQIKDVVDRINRQINTNHRRQEDGLNKDKDTKKEQKLNERVVFEKEMDFTHTQFLTQRLAETKNELHTIDTYLLQVAMRQNIAPTTVTKSEKLSTFQWKPTSSTITTQGLTLQHRVIRVDKYKHALLTNDQQYKTKFEKDHLESKKNTFDWEKLFRNKNPIILEVGSGTGEWIINKAQQNPNINFIAGEILPTRVYDIYSRMLLNHVTNVIILQGDSFFALEQLFLKKTLHSIFVNFPEPPWYSHWQYRLLNTTFFQIAHEKLVKTKLVLEGQDPDYDKYGLNGQGTITILTDDSWYTYLITRQLFSDSGDCQDTFVSLLSDRDGKSQQFQTTLPEAYGTSYYHRFWKKGQKFRRYYMKLGKNNNIKDVKAVIDANKIRVEEKLNANKIEREAIAKAKKDKDVKMNDKKQTNKNKQDKDTKLNEFDLVQLSEGVVNDEIQLPSKPLIEKRAKRQLQKANEKALAAKAERAEKRGKK